MFSSTVPLLNLDVTLSESSMTRGDKKLMELRKRIYDGGERDFSPHAKLNKGGQDLRVHFFVDKTWQLVVIGHCVSERFSYSGSAHPFL